jgi:DNA invertase Pin-like site-specific DNA recombinase
MTESADNIHSPWFSKAIELVQAGRVRHFIVKDMSRFGRDYLKVGFYTEVLFSDMGVHFVAINDGVDSAQGENEFTPFRNIINEWYAKDTSKKIKAVIRSKGNAGGKLCVNPPYGYIKDPQDKNHWLIDEEAAEVVKKIFGYCIAGNGPMRIATLLTKEKILIPSVYFKGKGINVPAKSLRVDRLQ